MLCEHTTMTNPPWEFSIDVSGTFTDCLARPPEGEFLRHELLSSEVVKGAAGQGSTAGGLRTLSDATRRPAIGLGGRRRDGRSVPFTGADSPIFACAINLLLDEFTGF